MHIKNFSHDCLKCSAIYSGQRFKCVYDHVFNFYDKYRTLLKCSSFKRKKRTKKFQCICADDSEMVFNLEEDASEDTFRQRNSSTSMPQPSNLVATLLHKPRSRSPLGFKANSVRQLKHVSFLKFCFVCCYYKR